ncbi:MAG: Cna B-type domain-containing protein, partial [Clostridia bacterium]|nr:Cna B-type domain-containing protein [Clostridia bacterium]
GRSGKVVKYDQSGNIEWENTDKTYNYQGVTTVEGEVIAVGEYGKVVKYDQSGNIEWENTEKSYSYYGVTTVEGGAIAVGDSGKIVKYDQSGNIEWENTEKSYNFNGVVETNDGLILATENDGIALYKKVITSPEIPDAQNVTVTNKKKRVKITTEVEGTGGSITGQNEAPYEEVKYGEDSVKEIKAVPSDGYSVVKITVNGEEIDFTENDDTTVTLSKFIEMTEDKHVVVTFSDNVSAIEVNHYLWTPSSGVTTTKVADSSTQKGNIDDNYSTVPKFDIEYEIVKNKDIYRNKTEDEIISEINTQYGTTYTSVTDLGYTEITDHEDDNYGKTPFEQFMQDYYIPENATGEFKAETQEINYYYKEITYTLTVKHLIEGTEESVPSITGGTVEDEITDNYSKNSEYETTNSNQVDYSKYQLVEVPENATGTIQGDTEVRYYYRQIEHQITTKVQEHEETNIYGIVEQVKGGTITGEGELPYETVAHGEDSVKDIKAVPEENYEVKSITVNGTPIEFTANADGTVTLAKFIEVTEDKEVIVEFQKKEGRVIIHHYEEGTTTPITLNNGDTATDIVKTGRIGEVYASQPHENAAIKYKVTNATPERSSGRFIDGTIEVTYYYSIRKVEVTVNKVWDDNNNSLEIRPESVRVNLKATIGTESTGIQDVTESVISTDIQKEISLNSGNNWEHTWDNLLQYTEDSQEITYNIEEESFTGNLAIVYSSEVTKDASNPYSLTVTNTYTRPTEKINYVVTKIWDDNSNENGKRPDNLVFDIYKIGENDSRTKVTTYTLNTLSETSHTFELDRYDEKGNEINYVAEEAEKNEGDLHLYTQSGGEKQDITTSGKKTYKSEFTNKFEVPDENVNIEVTKQWDDENNSNQKRPSSIKLVLYRVETLGTGTSATSRNEKVTEYTLDTPSNSNTFEYTFENQPKYDEHGNEITYIVDEEEVNEDDLKLYTKTVQETEENKYNIKNTFTVPDEKIEIEATKVWNEQNDTQKQKRPTSVILKLMNGTETVKSTAVNAQNSWKTTFSDLAKYDETGDEIDYRLAEEEVNTDDLKFYTSAESSSLQRVDDTHYKLTLTNTFGIPNDKIELKVTKAWDDEDGKDRLSSLKLVLTGNGQRYEHILTEANEDSTNSNNWIYTFTNLPKYDSNGEEITYALTEEEVNTGDLEKYITSVDGYTVTNKLKIRDTKIEKTGTTEITSLSDKVNYTINYEAKIDTNYTGTCKVTITDTLPYEIDEAQEYNLNEGTYTAENKTIKWEENVTPTDGKISITKQISFAYKDLPLNIDKFTNKVEGKIECENNITETKEIEWDTIVNFKRNIIVTKEWKGDTTSTQRPEEVEIELRKDGDVEETRQIKLANNWKETFENLNKYDETTRAEIAYTVTENNVPEGYYVEITTEDVSSTGANNLGFKVTNNKYGAIKVTKVDQNDNTKKIGGAEFTLTKLKWENEKWVEDSSYKKVETTSQEETKLGLAEFKNLVYGKYRLQETKAPEGYELIRETMDIDINETNTNYETIVQNKEKTTLPATGAYTKIAAIALGCLLIIVAIRIRNKRHSHY